jgi:hypothetical protein
MPFHQRSPRSSPTFRLRHRTSPYIKSDDHLHGLAFIFLLVFIVLIPSTVGHIYLISSALYFVFVPWSVRVHLHRLLRSPLHRFCSLDCHSVLLGSSGPLPPSRPGPGHMRILMAMQTCMRPIFSFPEVFVISPKVYLYTLRCLRASASFPPASLGPFAPTRPWI